MKKLVATFTVLLIVFTGNLFSQSVGDYRSAAAGDWSASATWEIYNGASWDPAGSAPTGSENITVDDSVNVDAAATITGYVKVEGSGKLVVGAGSITFDTLSTYEHAINGGEIPLATWEPGSTCLVTGVTSSSPGNSNQDFYNFTWNCAGQSSNLDVSWSGNTIGGDVTVDSSGAGPSQLRLTSSSHYTDSITINGNVIVHGGVLTATGSSTTMAYTIVVNGNITVTGGSFALSRGSGGNATWYVGGNLSVSNAEVRSSNSDAEFLFYSGGTHTLSYSSVTYNGTVNYEISASNTLNIPDGPDSVDLPVNGTLKNAGTINATGAISFQNGSTYHHAMNGGNIPIATWDAGSTLLVDAVTNTMPGNRSQNFYNIIWDCPDQGGNYNFGFNGATIGGDVTINNTGTGRLYLCGPATAESVSVDINGNLTLTQGNFAAQGTGNASSTVTVHVYGNVVATSGNFSVARGSQGGTGVTNFYVHGNFSLSDASTQNSNPGGAKFIFAGASPQTLSFSNVTFGGGGCPVEVDSGSTLNVGESQFGNSGTFDLKAYATLGCGNAGGLDSTLQNTGTTNLDPAANYMFNGTAAQATGTLLPATVNDLTINNSNGVTLSGDVEVDGNLNVNSGNLDLNGHTITLGSSAMLNETAGNTVMGSSGMIKTTRDLNAPAGVNVAGLGAMLTSSANLGSTVIERFHSAAAADGNESILRQYRISPANNSGLNATLRFYYDESELNGIAEADLALFKSPDGTNSWVNNGGTVNATDNYVELAGIGSFSYWTLADVGHPLPVELVSFTAVSDGKFVTLNWTTASELNNQGWNIERRVKNKENNFSEWSKVGFVAGTGNNTSIVVHSFKDQSVSSGSYQYRLKQIDLDGSFAYSKTVEADVNMPTEFALYQNYPNPFNPETVIRFEIPVTSFVNLTIYNALGEKVATLINQQMDRGVYRWNFNASNYPSGVYIYRLNAGDQLFTKKMMLLK